MSLARNLYSKVAHAYARIVGSELAKFGLRYDDLLINSPDVKEAVNRLPEDERQARYARMKRASDCDVKHKYIPEHLRDEKDVFVPYLTPRVEEVRRSRVEKAVYDR